MNTEISCFSVVVCLIYRSGDAAQAMDTEEGGESNSVNPSKRKQARKKKNIVEADPKKISIGDIEQMPEVTIMAVLDLRLLLV